MMSSSERYCRLCCPPHRSCRRPIYRCVRFYELGQPALPVSPDRRGFLRRRPEATQPSIGALLPASNHRLAFAERFFLHRQATRGMTGAAVARAFHQIAAAPSTGQPAGWRQSRSAKMPRQNASGQRIDSGHGMSVSLLATFTGSTAVHKVGDMARMSASLIRANEGWRASCRDRAWNRLSARPLHRVVELFRRCTCQCRVLYPA